MDIFLQASGVCADKKPSFVLGPLFQTSNSKGSCQFGTVWLCWGSDSTERRRCARRPSSHPQRKCRHFPCPSPRPRGAYMKRQKADIIHHALQELELRHPNSENIAPLETTPQPEKALEPTDTQEQNSTAAEQPSGTDSESNTGPLPIVLQCEKGTEPTQPIDSFQPESTAAEQPCGTDSESNTEPLPIVPQCEKATEPTQPIDSFQPESTAAEQPRQTEASSRCKKTVSKRCQASVQVPQRTRRIQVSMDKKATVSTGTQCSTLSDGIPLRVAAGLTPDLSQQCALETVLDHHSDTESDIEDHCAREDPDYDPVDKEDPESDDSGDECEEGFRLHSDVSPEEERQFLVSEVQLAQLLQNCVICGSPCETVVKYTRGTMISTSSACASGHTRTWESQRCHQGMPWANLLVAGAIVFSGANASKSLRLFRHLNLQMISTSTFSRLQSSYVVPASVFTWDFHQQTLLDEYQGRRLTLGGDARCDSPGFTAKFGSYTLMELSSGKILDFQLVQSNEVAGSTHMELEGLRGGFNVLKMQVFRWKLSSPTDMV
ncbi:uncharacterized protein LOC134247689 [Saccostrea cucullata]|uniref:uncharacterized protein LOC134247689 n=1 Tax=Saccostrea cuccullata TaxID=36930 RepID=UPI002ECFECDF